MPLNQHTGPLKSFCECFNITYVVFYVVLILTHLYNVGYQQQSIIIYMIIMFIASNCLYNWSQITVLSRKLQEFTLGNFSIYSNIANVLNKKNTLFWNRILRVSLFMMHIVSKNVYYKWVSSLHPDWTAHYMKQHARTIDEFML